jgi:cephalosporin hydroxylase
MKYDKNIVIKTHGDHPQIDRNLYTDKVMNIEDMKIINRRYMGAGMSQNYASIYFQEYYIESNRFDYVVEFGSQKGALSTYLANMAALTESYVFDTYEMFPDQDWNIRRNEGAGHWFSKLAEISPYINYHHTNVFTEETYNHVKENLEQFKTYIFCDGGDKAREFNMYAPLLKQGDRIAVHDWNMEVRMEQLTETMDKYNIIVDEPFAESATNLGTWIMPFRKA